MIEGVAISLGGKPYTVPPINFSGLKKLKQDIEAIGSASFGADIETNTIDAVVRIVHTALKRNYPDLTEEAVADGIDLANAGPIMMAVMGASGFKLGESQAPQASAAQSTGTQSTDSSSTSTTGPGNTSTSA